MTCWSVHVGSSKASWIQVGLISRQETFQKVDDVSEEIILQMWKRTEAEGNPPVKESQSRLWFTLIPEGHRNSSEAQRQLFILFSSEFHVAVPVSINIYICPLLLIAILTKTKAKDIFCTVLFISAGLLVKNENNFIDMVHLKTEFTKSLKTKQSSWTRKRLVGRS